MLNKYRHIIYSLIGALLITAIAGSGLLQRPDRWVSDSLFQTNQMLSGDIVIIGIDDATLAEFGPYHNWDRNIMASALEVLGSDEANKPAVVAVDTLYTGRTNDEADTRLANAAKNINLVTATAAEFGTVAIYGDEGFSGNTSTVVGYNEPYEELRSVTTQGHINAMYDLDGILRHALLYVSPFNGLYDSKEIPRDEGRDNNRTCHEPARSFLCSHVISSGWLLRRRITFKAH